MTRCADYDGWQLRRYWRAQGWPFNWQSTASCDWCDQQGWFC